jgi:hypothetical protein
MRNALIRLGDSANEIPYLAPFGKEVVIRIDHNKGSELFVVCHIHHGLSPAPSSIFKNRGLDRPGASSASHGSPRNGSQLGLRSTLHPT